VGPAISGSADVMVNGRPAVRVNDNGIHAACCGANTWQAQKGAPNVYINGKAAFRLNDQSKHCGGSGTLIEGSSDVIVGDGGGGGGGSRGGGSAGSAGSCGSSATPDSSSASTAASSHASNPATLTAAQTSPPSDDVYVLSRRIVGRGGTPLREHRVEIVHSDTGELVGVPQDTDAEGNLFVEVPENRPYHLRLVDPAGPIDAPYDLELAPAGDVDMEESLLTVRLLDNRGRALAHERIDVRAPNGTTFTITTNADGEYHRATDQGVYELTVRQHIYKLHTLRDRYCDPAVPCRLIVRT